MARYKVDKKLFDQKQLEEQLLQIETKSKYLKDEPLRRSEVDEYNKLMANNWVKNTLISIGVIAATAVAIIIFVLLGNMLMTNGRTGDIGKESIDSSVLYQSFEESALYPEPALATSGSRVVTYKVPYQWTDDNGTVDTIDDVTYTFLLNSSDDVHVIYEFIWRATLEDDGSWVAGNGEWIVGTTRTSGVTTIGFLSLRDDIGKNNDDYTLDVQKVSLNTLMTNFFVGQEDGWAKTLIKDFFYTAWPLTIVLWMVFIGVIVGYATLTVVGIRYVIRTIIVVLRKAGYIASDFAKEVVDAVRSEIPLVESDKVEELDFTEMKDRLEKKLKADKDKFKSEQESEDVVEEVQLKKTTKKSPEPEVVAEEVTTEEVDPGKDKSAKDKMMDIFD